MMSPVQVVRRRAFKIKISQIVCQSLLDGWFAVPPHEVAFRVNLLLFTQHVVCGTIDGIWCVFLFKDQVLFIVLRYQASVPGIMVAYNFWDMQTYMFFNDFLADTLIITI